MNLAMLPPYLLSVPVGGLVDELGFFPTSAPST
jgi:hypothetical protein